MTASATEPRPPVDTVRPFKNCPRAAKDAMGSKCPASAMSLRSTTSWPFSVCRLAIASSLWPWAAARVIVPPEEIENSAELEITAFIAPTPAI